MDIIRNEAGIYKLFLNRNGLKVLKMGALLTASGTLTTRIYRWFGTGGMCGRAEPEGKFI
jgi:hypothetical protein